MKFIIQRVSQASVSVNTQTIGSIGPGLLILSGYRKDDDFSMIARMVNKCLHLRIFEDEQSKMNLSILDVKGEILLVSQFTLYADCRRGRRPGFEQAMPPSDAEKFYLATVEEFRRSGLKTAAGLFAAKMQVELVNDGPVTIILDDEDLF